MKLRTKTFAYGVAGLAVAGAILSVGSTLGLITLSASGTLSVMLTDPPSVPAGVSSIYLTYTGLGVHPKGFANSTWISVSGEGTIDTMTLINLSQTISTSNVPSLTYNLVRFNISNVLVDYMGKNYSATIGSGSLTVPIVGGLVVNSSGLAATLVDIQPTVINVGSQAAPSFTIAAGAKALQIPSGEVNDSVKQIGHTAPLEGNNWFQSFKSRHADNLTFSALSLTSGSLSFSLKNGGSDSVPIKMVIVTSGPAGDSDGNVLAAVVSGAVFSVGADGSLQLLTGPPGQIGELLGGPGYTLMPGATHTFSYAGTVSALLGNNGISGGETYYLVVLGSGTMAVQSVMAS